MEADIRYGKREVSVYRTYAAPMTGITPIPESNFTGRENTLFAVDVDVAVFGNNFMPSYTEGDNSNVVATDSMKNFILQKGLEYPGATPEGFLEFLGRAFLGTYAQMESLRLTGREIPFHPTPVPGVDGGVGPSNVLFSRSADDHGLAVIDFARAGDSVCVTAHRCGCVGLRLIKVTGSAFTRFVRDNFTTLPERVDRPLFIYLDVFWKYADPADMLAPNLVRYIPTAQVRDLVGVVFHEFVSLSIQHLVHEMGTRLLARFPQMAEVAFEAQNRLWDSVATSATEERVKVYCDPRPPYGSIGLVLRREEP